MSSHVGLKQLKCRQKNWVRNQNVHSATQKSQALKCDHPEREGEMPCKMPGWGAHMAYPQHLISPLGRALLFCLSTETEGHMPAIMCFLSNSVSNNLVSVTALLPPESPYCSPTFMGFQSDL